MIDIPLCQFQGSDYGVLRETPTELYSEKRTGDGRVIRSVEIETLRAELDERAINQSEHHGAA